MTKAAERAAAEIIAQQPEDPAELQTIIDRECHLKKLLAVARAAQKFMQAHDAAMSVEGDEFLRASDIKHARHLELAETVAALPDLKELE